MAKRAYFPASNLRADVIDATFEALGNDRRRRLLAEIVRRRAATASELAAGARMSRQGVSKHLAELADVGLVTRTRIGRSVFFKLNAAGMFSALSWLAEIGSAEALAQQGSPDG